MPVQLDEYTVAVLKVYQVLPCSPGDSDRQLRTTDACQALRVDLLVCLPDHDIPGPGLFQLDISLALSLHFL